MRSKRGFPVSETRRFNFTQSSLRGLQPGTKRYYVHDTKVRGLSLAVTPAGERVFFLYRRVQGAPTRIRIARFDSEMSLEDARKRAAVLNAEIAQGKNPHKEKQTKAHEATLGDAFQSYLDLHVKPHCKRPEAVKWAFDKYLAGWKNRKLSAITRADVLKLHAKMGKNTKYQANRTIALLRATFNHHVKLTGEGSNPCTGVTMFKEHPRARFLNGDELQRFFKALAKEPDHTVRDCILTMLLTGARRSNAQGMCWADIDLDRGLWTIPAEHSKNAEPMIVILPEPAVVLLRQRRTKAKPKATFVFESYGKSKHLVELKGAWARLRERAKLPGVRMHDLRRSLGSWCAGTGASLPIIGKALGHRTPQATAIYARLDVDPVRRAVEMATKAMLVAGDAHIEADDGKEKTTALAIA